MLGLILNQKNLFQKLLFFDINMMEQFIRVTISGALFF